MRQKPKTTQKISFRVRNGWFVFWQKIVGKNKFPKSNFELPKPNRKKHNLIFNQRQIKMFWYRLKNNLSKDIFVKVQTTAKNIFHRLKNIVNPTSEIKLAKLRQRILQKEFTKNVSKQKIKNSIENNLANIFYQKTKTGFQIIFSQIIYRRLAATALLIVFVTSIFLQNSKYSQGATFTFTQSSWSGGVTVNPMSHPTNQNGWTQYESASSSVNSAVAGEISLSRANASVTQTTDTDFSAGTPTNVYVSGSGAAAQVKMVTNAKVLKANDVSIILKSDGTVWTAGTSNKGTLGLGGGITVSTTFAQVVGLGGSGFLTDVVDIAATQTTVYALKTDGTVWGWGGNYNNDFCNNTGSPAYDNFAPVQISAISNVRAMDGKMVILFLKTDNTVWGCGQNSNGQLGNGTKTAPNVPVQATGLTNVISIGAGLTHSVAVKSDGTVWAWGDNTYGKLGDGTITERLTPVQVQGGLSGILSADGNATGNGNYGYFSLALKSDGTVWSWGYNGRGQLGIGTTGNGSTTPVQVSVLSQITDISANSEDALAINASGDVWGWGRGLFGALGCNSSCGNTTAPIRVHGINDIGLLTGVADLDTTYDSVIAIMSNGDIVGWGNNSSGQLGMGNTTQYNYPVRLLGPGGIGTFNAGNPTFQSAGSLESSVIDLGSSVDFTTLAYTASGSDPNVVKFQLASSDSSQGPWNYVGSDGTAGTYFTSSGLSIPAALDNKRYVRYKAYFSGNNPSGRPTLSDVTINYQLYPTNQTLISSAFNTGDIANILANIYWTETLPAGTDIRFQVRTSPDGSAWTAWLGPDGTTSTYFTDPSGAEGMPSVFLSGQDDKWFQYKAYLDTDGINTPTLSEVSVVYVVNAPPEIQNIVATQNSNGTVSISYQAKDSDTSTGATAGFVDASLQYCTANCTNVGSETWVNATTVSGDVGAVSVAEGSWTDHNMTWTPKNDYNNQYTAEAKIRIKLNDAEAANNLVYGSSNNFILDTKNPTNLSFTINHTNNNLTITTPADDSSYQMSISNIANTFPVFENFSSPYIYNNLTNDPATVYIRIKDAYGNYTDAQTTTPAKANNPVYYDTSNPSQQLYQEFIAWDVVPLAQVGSGFSAYKIYRQKDAGSFSLLATINDRDFNYYLDKIKDVDPNTIDSDSDFNADSPSSYTYRILIMDTNGNTSVYSNTVTDIPNGMGGSDSTPPTISNVQVSNIETTSARITWDTDEISTSSVGYSTNVSYLPEKGSASLIANGHEVILTGLTPGTTYNIRVKSYDNLGNLASNDKDDPGVTPIPNFTFTTLDGPAISSVTTSSISNNQATIDWRTTTDSSTYVVYSNTISNGALVNPIEIGSPAMVGGAAPFMHRQSITGLTEDTIYYFYVKSVDASNNTAFDKNGGAFYQLLTTLDSTPPIISNVNAAIINNTKAAINWVTDEPADSKVIYSTQQGGPYSNEETITTYNISHYVILNGLTPNKQYYYKVISKDINGNERSSIEETFTTQNNPEFQHNPLSAITDVTVALVTDTKAVISFNTDQPALCLIQSGTSSNNYTNDVAKEDGYDAKLKFNARHSIHINSLIFSTKYYYKISCLDNLDTAVPSSEYDFMTLEKLYTASGIGALYDSKPPVIANVNAKSVNGESVTITWDTDEKSNSLVSFGLQSISENVAGNALVNKMSANYVTTHEATINNLTPGTKYIFTVSSTDASGNISESSESSFTTSSPSSLSSIKISSTNLNEAEVTWKTSQKATSLVEYGLTNLYGEKKENTSYATDHIIKLSGLQSGQLYHFRVKGKDENNNLYSSGDYTFQPKSPPKITNINITDVTEKSAKVNFVTDVPTDALVTYANITDANDSGSQGIPQLTTNHNIDLKNLNPGVTYVIKIKVRDESGNESEDMENKRFTVGKDDIPPKIDQIKTDSALSQSDKVQTIISWITDEPATGKITYKEGIRGEEKEINISNEFSTKHSVVFTIFKPGTVYYFKVKSKDSSNNEAVSSEYALLTPRRKENIIQVIVSNFQDIFKWTKF